ncbi:MAG: hypothetical protein QXL98_01435 [Thermofilaceae archaeon]
MKLPRNLEAYRRYMREYMRRYNRAKRQLLEAVLSLPPDYVEKVLGVKIPPELRKRRKRGKGRRKADARSEA